VNKKTFDKYLNRDGHCYHCGLDDDTLVPQHRVGRGMGGSKKLDRASNIIVLCSAFNGLIEADADAARRARHNGWKLDSWVDPLFEPVFDSLTRTWFMLDDDFGKESLYPW
jgi:hypothetical protein